MFDWFKIKKEEISENERIAGALMALAEQTFEDGYYGSNNVVPITKNKKEDGRRNQTEEN